MTNARSEQPRRVVCEPAVCSTAKLDIAADSLLGQFERSLLPSTSLVRPRHRPLARLTEDESLGTQSAFDSLPLTSAFHELHVIAEAGIGYFSDDQVAVVVDDLAEAVAVAFGATTALNAFTVDDRIVEHLIRGMTDDDAVLRPA